MTLDELYGRGLTIIPMLDRASEADSINRLSDGALKYAYENYLNEVERVTDTIQRMDQRKKEIIENQMQRFVDAFSKIKDIEYQENYIPDKYKKYFSKANVSIIQETVMDYWEFIKSGTGLAAKNGIFVNMICLNNKSKEMLNNAKINRNRTEIQIARIDVEIEAMQVVISQTKQVNKFLRKLVQQVNTPLLEMEEIVQENNNWKQISTEQKYTIMAVVKYMQVIKSLIEIPIVLEDGTCNEEVGQLLLECDKEVISDTGI